MKKIKKKEKGKGKGKVKELPLKKFKCGAKFQGIVDVQAVVATKHKTDCRDEVSIWSFTTLWSMLSMNSLDAKKEDPWNEIQV